MSPPQQGLAVSVAASVCPGVSDVIVGVSRRGKAGLVNEMAAGYDLPRSPRAIEAEAGPLHLNCRDAPYIGE